MDIKFIKYVGVLICLGLVGCNSVKPNDNSVVKASSKNVSSQDPTDQANRLMAERKFSDAVELLEPYVAKMPANWQPRVETANSISVHYWDQEHLMQCVGVEALSKKKVDAVMGGSYSRAYYLLAYISLELHDTQKANNYLDHGLALEPNSATLLAEKGTLNQVAGHPELAITFFQKAIDSKGCVLNRELGKAYRGLGVSLIDLEKLDEAEKALYTSLKYSPDNQIAIHELNYIDKLRNGKPKQPLSTKLQQTQ